MGTNIEKELSECTLLHCFEVPVTDRRTNEDTFLLFEISVCEGELKATHEALPEEQEKSDKIAFVSVQIDSNFDLQAHLEWLFSNIQDEIIWSDFFILREE